MDDDCGNCGRCELDYCPCGEIDRIHQVGEHVEIRYPSELELGYATDHC